MSFFIGERRFQERIDDVLRGLKTDDSGTEADDIGIVVKTGKTGAGRLGDAGGADPSDLIAGIADTQTCTADRDAEFDFLISDGIGEEFSLDRIVGSGEGVCTEVRDFITLLLRYSTSLSFSSVPA